MDLNVLLGGVEKSTQEEMHELIDNVLGKLKNERKEKGRSALHHLPSEGNVVIIGDLHGDLESLSFILKHSKFSTNRRDYLVFLGDYGDRGSHSAEVYFVILTLKKEFSDRVILLRGNHEFPSDLLVYPHDLPLRLVERYGSDGEEIYKKLRDMFGYFDNGVIVEGKYIMLHGGLPTGMKSLKDVAFAHRTHPSTSHLEEIIWSDPKDGIKGFYHSPRGAGRIFGKDVTERVLKMIGVKTLIRSHEACEGVDVRHDGRILTIFSRKGPPYYNSHAAYLKLDLSEEAKDAYGLSKIAHKF